MRRHLRGLLGAAGLIAAALGAASCGPATPGALSAPEPELRILGSRWDEVRLWRGIEEPPPPGWTEVGFDDQDWEVQLVWMGYGVEGDAITTWLGDAPGKYAAVYVRRTIELGPTARAYRRLRFTTASAGGWAVYVNGVELAREALPPDADHTTPALGDGPEYVDLDVPEGLLREGQNVFAIESHLTDPPPPAYLLLAEVYAIAEWAQRPAFITRGPYLQRPTTDEMTLVFQTSRPVASRLRLNRPGETPRTFWHPEATRHVYRLQGLRPSSHYEWLLALAAGSGPVEITRGAARPAAEPLTQRHSGSFSTAPLPDEPFSFLVYGDTRNESTVHGRLIAQMVQSPGDFVIHVGDFVWAGGEVNWDAYFAVAQPLIGRVPLIPTLGNHEFWNDGGASRYLMLFVVPENGPPDQGKSTYAFTYGNSRFLVLNASAEGRIWDWGTQPSWLRRELEKAAADASIRHVFVSMHVPLVSSGPLGPGPRSEEILGVMQEMAERGRGPGKRGVSLLLQGHEHYYERGELDNGLRYLTAGGGGGGLTPAPKKPLATSRVLVSEYHYVKIDVNGPDVRVQTRRPDGTLLDEWQFSE